MDMEPTPEEEKGETPQPKQSNSTSSTLKTVGNNIAAAGIFSAAIVALLKYLETVEKLPEPMRQPLYLLCVIVLSITLSVFGFSIVRLLWTQSQKDAFEKQLEREKQLKQQEINLQRMENDKTRARIEGMQLEKQLQNNEEVSAVVALPQSQPQQVNTSADNAPVDTTRFNTPEAGQQIILGQGQDDGQQ